MKKIFVIAVGCLCTLAVLAHGQVLSELSMPPNGDNERAEISQWIGPVKISIEYHSPNVHGGGGADRTGHIWGEVVHYGFLMKGSVRRTPHPGESARTRALSSPYRMM
jgi:hypothetical protein